MEYHWLSRKIHSKIRYPLGLFFSWFEYMGQVESLLSPVDMLDFNYHDFSDNGEEFEGQQIMEEPLS